MLKKIIKNFVLFSMIFLLNNSVIETIAYATEQNNTLSSETASNISSKIDSKNLNNSTNEESSKDTSKESSKNSSTTASNKDNGKDDKLDNNELDNPKKEEFIAYGWKTIENKKYYLVANKISETTGWFMEKDVNPNITPKDENYEAKYYLDKDFSVVVGWKEIKDKWYYFNSEGIMQTGWILDTISYHLDNAGIMQTGWNKIDGYTYYFDQYGKMIIGKILIDNHWYFFDNKGRLEKGFYNYNGKTYYSDESGIMVTNKWITKGNHKYYIKSDGSTAIGNIFLNGIMEKFDENGYYDGSDSRDKNVLYLQYLNVGNADCAFIKLPSGETVLIDTGDTTTTTTLINFLKAQNLKTEFYVPKIDGQATTSASSTFLTANTTNTNSTKNGKGVIDYVVLTHPHSDHIGGMIELMKNFNIGKVIVPKYFEMKDFTAGIPVTKENKSDFNIIKYDYKVYIDTMDALSKSGIPLVEAKPEAYIDDEHILQFLHANIDYTKLESNTPIESYAEFNDNSAIVYLNYCDLQGLFAADMQWKAEKSFVERGALKNQPVDILKVPHHGNVGSSSYTFIGYVKPTIAVITRAKDAINTNSEPYDVLTTCGVNIYEASLTDGVSVYATKDNWNIEDK